MAAKGSGAREHAVGIRSILHIKSNASFITSSLLVSYGGVRTNHSFRHQTALLINHLTAGGGVVCR